MLKHALPFAIWITSTLGAPSPSGFGGRFHIDQVHNRNARRNGPAEYAFAHAKYHAPIPQGLSKTMAAMKKVKLGAGNASESTRLPPRCYVDGFTHGKFIDDALNIAGEVPSWPQELDIEYLSPIMVGEPAQMVWMNLDTGSSDT